MIERTYAHKRTCKKCGQTKPIEQFHKRTRGTRDNLCRDCRNAEHKEKYPYAERKTYAPNCAKVITPHRCPCGAIMEKPYNGYWLCEKCSPKHNESACKTNPLFDFTIETRSTCWICAYQKQCHEQVKKGLPILCEATLESELDITRNLKAFPIPIFEFTNSLT